MTTRIGPDQAERPQETVRRARSKALLRKGQVIVMRVVWAVVFGFIALVVTQKAWAGNWPVLLAVIVCGAVFGLWVGSGSADQE